MTSPGHQFLGRQTGPRAVAANAGQHTQLLAQERQRLLRAAFLQQTQRRIQNEQSADHGRFHLLAEKELDDDSGFQQPRDRRPEPLEEVLQRVGFLLHDGIGAELLQPCLRLGGGQATVIMIGDPSSRCVLLITLVAVLGTAQRVGPGNSFRIAVRNWVNRCCLPTKPSVPAARAAARHSGVSSAVTMMTAGACERALIWRVASNPFIPGNRKSISTRSGASSTTRRTAWYPSVAVPMS